MKTGKKIRIFSAMMVLTLFISCNRFVVSAEAKTMLGDSVSVTVTGNTLLVEGDGIIPDYPETGSSNPLYEYRDTIDTVIVDIGIERIGDNGIYLNYLTRAV